MEPKEQKPHINVDYFEDLTADVTAGGRPVGIEAIGERVRQLREARQLSIETLSQLTGFEVPLLAGIESGAVQPQLGTVIKLSKALDSAFGRLVSGVGDRVYSITRRAEQRAVSRSTSHQGKQHLYTYKSLAPEVQGRHMEALIVCLGENPQRESSVHDGEEFIYVLEGEVLFQIADESFTLAPGDSVYYLSTVAHMLAAREKSATILAVIYGG
jgi:quercetin dioxygenase-like cupin family protein